MTYKILRLSNGKVSYLDPEDFEKFGNNKYHISGGYASRRKGKVQVLLHREIMNAQPGQEIDHINGRKLDNRKCNLRFCTSAQNGYNKGKAKGKHSSKYKGVHFHKSANKWHANIGVNNRRIFLGSFDTELEAAEAFDAAAEHYHGEFARFNLKQG